MCHSNISGFVDDYSKVMRDTLQLQSIRKDDNQTGPKLVYSVEQRKSLELMTIVEEKCPIAQRGDTVR